MRRSVLVALGLCALVALGVWPRTAMADPRTGYLIEQLKTSDDYRVRTQAALALGASGDDAAMKPLCDALGDANPSVKVAAAAGLGKLGKAEAVGCLKAADAKEGAGSVKSQIQKSISGLQSGGGSAAAAIGPGTKVYVAIQITNKTSRGAPEIDGLIRGVITSKLQSRAGYAIAPKGETAAAGGQIVKSKSLKGFFLIATVESPQYDSGNLTQIVRVSMWTYPGKALQGEFSPKLTQTGTSPGDTQSENTLMKMCVENAIETFLKVAASM